MINYIKTGGIAQIRLNRPDVYNSFNRDMALAVQKALKQSAEDDEIRLILITGEGKAFCAGQDLSEVVDPEGPALEKIVSEHFNPMIELIRAIEKPVIAGVNGVAAGAGANIALACDIAIAKESASFIQAFSKIGLIPDSGGTFFLPRIIGMQRAAAFMMTGEKVSAKDAAEMGMIYKCVADENYEETLATFIDKLSKMPTRGLALTKLALNKSFTNNLTEQLSTEHEYQNMAGNTHDYNEGVQAFLEKRKPNFKGN